MTLSCPQAAGRPAWAGADHDVCHRLSRLATLSLAAEAALTPKPGLVDAATCGAHSDMTLQTFLDSARALSPFFERYARAGSQAKGPVALAAALREAGVPAESAMFSATGGVNTHKGANFSFALILGASARILCARQAPTPSGTQLGHSVLALTAELGSTLFEQDRARLLGEAEARELSHGERLYLEHGVAGVRGEAAHGYPALANTLLPRLRRDAARGMGARESLLRALVDLMATLEDTNLLHRGGEAALAAVRRECAVIAAADLSLGGLEGALMRYDRVLTERWLSPGGSADLLGLGIYFALLEGLWSPDDLDWVPAATG